MAEILTLREYEARRWSNMARLFPTAASKRFKPSSVLLGDLSRLEATLEAMAEYARAADAHWNEPSQKTQDTMIAARQPLREAGWLT